jgi:hypothetical protein
VPNNELFGEYEEILSKALFAYLAKGEDEVKYSIKLKNAIFKRDGETLTNMIGALYSNLPALHHPRGKKGMTKEALDTSKETFYHSMLYSSFYTVFRRVDIEKQAAKGNPDLIMELDDKSCAIMELKYESLPDSIEDEEYIKNHLTSRARFALKAIKDKEYGLAHIFEGKRVVRIGLGVCGRGKVLALFEDRPEPQKL